MWKHKLTFPKWISSSHPYNFTTAIFFLLCVHLQAQLLFLLTFCLKVFQFTYTCKSCASRFSRLAELHNGQNDEFWNTCIDGQSNDCLMHSIAIILRPMTQGFRVDRSSGGVTLKQTSFQGDNLKDTRWSFQIKSVRKRMLTLQSNFDLLRAREKPADWSRANVTWLLSNPEQRFYIRFTDMTCLILGPRRPFFWNDNFCDSLVGKKIRILTSRKQNDSKIVLLLTHTTWQWWSKISPIQGTVRAKKYKLHNFIYGVHAVLSMADKTCSLQFYLLSHRSF